MVIDIHTHAFPDKIARGAVDVLSRDAHMAAHTDGTMKGLLASMEEADIETSVVMPVATSPEQVVKVNDSSLRNNEKYYDEASDSADGSEGKIRRILSFGCIHPDFGDYRTELRRIAEHGIIGIKLHPVYQRCNIDDVKFLRMIDCAAENGLIVLTHAGLDVGIPGAVHCSPEMCRNVWDKIGNFKFILAHMGGWRNWEEVPELLADTGVYLDTSFSSGRIEPLNDGYWDDKDIKMMDADQFVKIIRAFGAGRIVFGSDSPWTNQKKSREFIESIPLEADEIAMILGGNAGKILHSFE